MRPAAVALAALGWRQAWVVDTEYKMPDGDLPQIHCVCAYDLISGERKEVSVELGVCCPFDMSPDVLFIFFEADADALAFMCAGWGAPLNILDPRVIWKKLDNGACEIGLDGKKKHYGLYEGADAFRLPRLPHSYKEAFRRLAIRGGPFTAEERRGLMLYCRSDVDLTVKLFEALWPFANLEDPIAFAQALVDGRYTAACARVYRNGYGIHISNYRRVFRGAVKARLGLIKASCGRFPVHTEDGHFSQALFGEFLKARDLLGVWPRTVTGLLSTKEETFKEMGKSYVIIGELMSHLALLDQLATLQLYVGRDGRSRVQLMPFGAKTGRNTPSGKGNLLAKSAALRPLIQPPRGRAMASLDWSAQELRIAANLSNDPELQRAAAAPDPYIGLAASLGLAKEADTKATNPKGRNIGKVAQLAMLYGIGANTFARKAGMTVAQAYAFLQRQRERFAVFSRWSDAVVAWAMQGKPLKTPLGWTLRFRPGATAKAPDRTSRNF
jgi:DNA polymerase I